MYLIRHVQTSQLLSTKKIKLTLNSIVIRGGDFLAFKFRGL